LERLRGQDDEDDDPQERPGVAEVDLDRDVEDLADPKGSQARRVHRPTIPGAAEGQPLARR
jgi:hypothetical protein